jgi:hypothetical protein
MALKTAPMRRFTPRAASPAIGNYGAEFAVARLRRNPQNPARKPANPDLAHELANELAETRAKT